MTILLHRLQHHFSLESHFVEVMQSLNYLSWERFLDWLDFEWKAFSNHFVILWCSRSLVVRWMKVLAQWIYRLILVQARRLLVDRLSRLYLNLTSHQVKVEFANSFWNQLALVILYWVMSFSALYQFYSIYHFVQIFIRFSIIQNCWCRSLLWAHLEHLPPS